MATMAIIMIIVQHICQEVRYIIAAKWFAYWQWLKCNGTGRNAVPVALIVSKMRSGSASCKKVNRNALFVLRNWPERILGLEMPMA